MSSTCGGRVPCGEVRKEGATMLLQGRSEIENSWEEIVSQSDELAGRQVRVVVLSGGPQRGEHEAVRTGYVEWSCACELSAN